MDREHAGAEHGGVVAGLGLRDLQVLGARGLGYERLDQLTLEVILGVR